MVRYTPAGMARAPYGEEIRTTPVRDQPRPGGAGLLLNVIGENVLATQALPARGEVVVGRSSQSTVCIDDPSISRRHAMLRIGAAGVTVEDLGSVNGTRVAGELIAPGAPRPVAPGESIEVGAVTLVVVAAPRRPGGRPRRLVSHGFFESRLEEECARGGRAQRPFAVVRLSGAGAHGEAFLQEALAQAVDAEHPVGTYGPGEYEVLLVGADGDAAARLVAGLERTLAGRGAQLRGGVAVFPRDGRAPEALMDHACRRLREPARGRSPSTPASPSKSPSPSKPPSPIVADPAMLELHRLAARVAAGNISVLLLGETGCGKEIFAETIHRHSPRRDRPLLRLNCAALSENLLESELFGH